MASEQDINAVFDQMAAEDPYQPGPWLDQEAGAPLLDRLAAAFKFDEQGVENYLREEYGKPNVFRGTDDNLYFLPPDQLSLPERERTFVRFDPEGVDLGDIVSFVPAAIGAIGGVAAAALSGGTSVPITLGALAAGGAAGEAVTQGIGAAIPGEEPTATPGARLGRMAVSGGLEMAGGAAGEVAKRVGPAIIQGVREGSRRSFQHALRHGVSPETIEATEALGRRTGIQFSEGQISGSRGALLVERFARQNFMSADIVNRADVAAVDALGKYAQKTIDNLGKEPFEVGVRKAVRAHEMHVDALNAKRREMTSPLFNRAKSAFGNERVIPLDASRKRLADLADELQSDVPTDDARHAAEWISEKLESLPSGKTSIKSLQNMLSDWGKAAYDPRGVIEKVQDHKLKKRIAATFFGGLQDDLAAAADNLDVVVREATSGQLRSGKGIAEAAQALREARSVYREMSEAIGQVADNPLTGYADNPEQLANLFLGQSSDPTSAKQIMGFLDEVAPAEANELRSSVMQQLLRRASRGNVDEPLSPALLRSMADKASVQLDALFAGNKKAKSAFDDMIASARKLADQGSLQGAQTEFMKLIELSLKGLAIPALAGSAFLSGGVSESGDEAASLAALFLGSRWLARSMMHPPAARAYSKLFTAATKPKLSDGAKQAVRQAAIDIISFNQRLDATGRGTPEQRQLAERVMRFAPGGI